MNERKSILGDSGRLIRAIASPQRIKLIKTLSKEPQYISKLAEKTGLDRSTTSYNLAVLESAKLLDSKYVILEQSHSKGKAARVYSINKKRLNEAIDLITDIRQLK